MIKIIYFHFLVLASLFSMYKQQRVTGFVIDKKEYKLLVANKQGQWWFKVDTIPFNNIKPGEPIMLKKKGNLWIKGF